MIDGVPLLNLEIAHICALEPGGKRFEPSLTVEQRNSFANLILLCHPDHKLVDGPRSDDYPINVLWSWKENRETTGMEALAGLSNLTEEKLATLIHAAQTTLLDRIGPALDEFAKTAPELAALLKTLTKELADPRIHGFGLSEDAVRKLYDASRTFANLEDNATTLSSAARDLRNLEDLATRLDNAADNVRSAANALTDARF
jgi:hypothetical protein